MVKVLYILGAPRSGSTLLDNVLGQLEGFFPVGELRRLWRAFAYDEPWTCGCGRMVRECEIWSKVVDEAFEDEAEARKVLELLHEVVRDRHGWLNVPRLLRQSPERMEEWPPLKNYADALQRVYKAIANVTGSCVIVDSSKGATDALVVGLLPDVSPYFLHLVRDPRGVLYSRYRRPSAMTDEVQPKESRGFAGTHLLTTPHVAGSWLLDNASAEMVVRGRGQGRSLLVRYEDFVSQPWATLEAVSAMVGEPFVAPTERTNKIEMGPAHTVHGNSRRFTTGLVELREDDEWVKGMHAADRLIATTLTLPLLLRYKYAARRTVESRARP